MYTLHMANKNYSSWSLRPWILMRMLDIPFEEHIVPFPSEGSFELYRAFSPSGAAISVSDRSCVVTNPIAPARDRPHTTASAP